MAEIVLGMCTSHGPMLSTPPEQWGLRAADDRKNPALHYRGREWSFEALEAERAATDFGLDAETQASRYAACRAGLKTLSDVFAEVKPDVCVIVGNDQMEMFWDGLVPTFAVYWGDEVPNRMPPAEYAARWPEGIRIAMRANAADEPMRFAGAPDLAGHIMRAVQAEGFDIASMQKVPPHRGGWESVPHAFGFVLHTIMQDRVPPTVPVVQNTFYPPNQPTVARAIAFGQALARAIQSWGEDRRVALIGSGGLTHFVIDEAVDRVVLDAIRRGDSAILEQLGEETFQSGTSEVKNWIPVIGAMAELGCRPEIVDYVPCYRSTAGTGTANCFVYWRPAAA